MKDLKYDSLSIQKYLISELFSQEEKKLMALLISMCYPAKLNFQKMHKRNLKCSLQCNEPETQMNIFEACPAILSKLDIRHDVKIQDIYGNINEQLNAIKLDGVGPVDNRPSTD